MEAFRYCFKSETKTFYTLIEYIEIFLHKKTLFVGFFKFRIRWLNRSPDHQQRSHIHEELTAERSPPKKMSALYDLLGYFFYSKGWSFTPLEKVNLEIIQYQKEKPLSLTGNPLEWWKKHEIYYAILSHLAKLYFGISATSVPSERVFSSAGDLITAQRATLKPEYIDMTVSLQKKIFK